jgi:hypothetical protein
MTDPSVKSKVPHVHAAVIKAWADGAEIQVKLAGDSVWLDCSPTGWFRNCEYRVKPPPPHKWQKEIDAYVAGKVVQYQLSMWPEHRWENLPGFRKNKETPEFQFSGTANAIFRIKPESVSFICRVGVPYGFSPKIVSSWQGEKPTSATWQENLRLTFEDGALIGAEVLKC